jgi:hypothetical protein
MNKPKLTAAQKKSFEKQFRELVKHEKAREAILYWDGTILWDLVDVPHMPGFKREKLREKLAVDYTALINRLSNRSI